MDKGSPVINIPQPLIDLLHKVDPGEQIMTFAVPLRIFRVVAVDETYHSFRVQQLVRTNKDAFNPRGTWKTLSLHGGKHPWDSYTSAFAAAHKAQADLKTKLLKVQRESQQAVQRSIRL